jgi:homoserine O-acetyltransferase
MICPLVFWSRAGQRTGGHHFGNLPSVSLIFLLVVFSFGFCTLGVSQAMQDWSPPREGDYIAKAFQFRDGSVLPELRLHSRVRGQPHRDSSGHVDNAVLILHGTGGASTQFLSARFAGILFFPGGLLDPAKYCIILADDIGHEES